jgi:hypothetical protein
MKVFLGGTCNESKWREHLIPHLTIDYFNPVVDDWTEECMAEELKQREECDICLYAITPKMTGVYSIAEVVDDSNKRPSKTVLAIFTTENNRQSFNNAQSRSLSQVAKMVEGNGGLTFKIHDYESIRGLAHHLNNIGE